MIAAVFAAPTETENENRDKRAIIAGLVPGHVTFEERGLTPFDE